MGMGTDRVVVVAGGAGVAGECVVEALLARGTTVAVPSRSPARLAALRAAHPGPGLSTYPGDMGSADGVRRVRDAIVAEHGEVDAVVAALGGWGEGPGFADLDDSVWHELLDTNLSSHLRLAHAFLPALADRPGSVYVTLNGIAADKPVPGSGPICVTGAAQRMMLRVLAEELAGRAVRLHEVAILTPIITRHWDDRPAKPDWLHGTQVGTYIADVLAPDFSNPDHLLLTLP
jgi:NAD(P)-dependent dehydrogenase (short-subunit alcohol dehydrogenase family)